MVIGLYNDDTEKLMSALSSDTSRNILPLLHNEPATASEIANTIDSSVQNIQYHLENLKEAGLIDMVNAIYSSKGNERL